MNHCHYMLTGDTWMVDNGIDARLWIECTKEKEIEISSSFCAIKVPSQTPTVGGITYTNESGKVKVTMTATGITYSAPGFGCALGGLPSHGNDMDYNGTITLAGFAYNSGLMTAPIEGSAVSISTS